jgi:hypothetical protein
MTWAAFDLFLLLSVRGTVLTLRYLFLFGRVLGVGFHEERNLARPVIFSNCARQDEGYDDVRSLYALDFCFSTAKDKSEIYDIKKRNNKLLSRNIKIKYAGIRA